MKNFSDIKERYEKLISKSNLSYNKYICNNSFFETNSISSTLIYNTTVPEHVIFSTTFPYSVIMGIYPGITDWIVDDQNTYLDETRVSVSQ